MRPRLIRVAPVLLVLILAPLTAEYLIGYDSSLTHPGEMLVGLLVLAPLYGAPAVLIRDLARRRHQGWPTILLLAAAFGVFQAGLVDQSLFNPDYRGITGWALLREPTLVPWLGTSAFMVVLFVGGHVLGSIAAPVALGESWWPGRRHEPWLGRLGTVLLLVLWAAGSLVVLEDHLAITSFRPSPGQLLGTSVVVLGLVALALTRSRRGPITDREAAAHPAPAPWVVGVVTAALLSVRSSGDLIGVGWLATAAAVLALVAWFGLVGRWARAAGWTPHHLLAAVIGDLVSIGGPALFSTTAGDPALALKVTANLSMLVLVLAVAARAWRAEALHTSTGPGPG